MDTVQNASFSCWKLKCDGVTRSEVEHDIAASMPVYLPQLYTSATFLSVGHQNFKDEVHSPLEENTPVFDKLHQIRSKSASHHHEERPSPPATIPHSHPHLHTYEELQHYDQCTCIRIQTKPTEMFLT